MFGLPALAGGGLASLLGGLGQKASTQEYVDPQAAQLYHRLLSIASQGQGEFGFANAVQTGEKTLADRLAGRGFSTKSGVGAGNLTSLLAQASAINAQNRNNYLLSLLRSSPQTYTKDNTPAWANTLGSLGGLGMQLGMADMLGIFDKQPASTTSTRSTGTQTNGTDWFEFS